MWLRKPYSPSANDRGIEIWLTISSIWSSRFNCAAYTCATEHGYVNCFDILEGFEGDKDADGHRKQIGGWCKAGLPWLGA